MKRSVQFSRSVISNSLQPHGLQHRRWKYISGTRSEESGATMCVCACVRVCVCVCVCVTQSCMTLYDPMGYSPPGSSVHEILQTRILEWVAILFSRESSEPRGQTWVSCIAGGFFTIWTTREAQSDLQLRSNRPEVKPTSSPRPGRTWSQRSLSASTVTTHTMEPPTPDGLADCNLILLA